MIIRYRRPAVAMIELIFAIVIMGIVMMSAPMLISSASQSIGVTLQQEGVNEASSRVNMLLTHAWDEQDTNNSCIPPVLLTVGDSELNSTTDNRRVGVPKNSNSRTFLCGTTQLNASALGIDPGDLVNDDIDDFTNTTLVVDLSGAGGKDYIEQNTVSIATAITYASDTANYANQIITYNANGAAAGATSNIKAIAVTLTSTSATTEFSKNIILRAFSANIGGYEFESREF